MFVWLGVAASVLSVRAGRWWLVAGAWARIVLLSLLSASLVAYAPEHGLHGLGSAQFAPSFQRFVLFLPVLVFVCVGLERQSKASRKIVEPVRDVPVARARGSVTTMLLYLPPVLGILLVLPAPESERLTSFMQTVGAVLTGYGGHVGRGGPALSGAGSVLAGLVCVALVVTLLTSGVKWLMGSDRMLAVASYDGAAPAPLGVFSARLGTPVRVNPCSGALASGTFLLSTAAAIGRFAARRPEIERAVA